MAMRGITASLRLFCKLNDDLREIGVNPVHFKYYRETNDNIECDRRCSDDIKWDSRCSQLTFLYFAFCFVLVWTDGSGPSTVPYSDCDGALIP